MSQAIQTPEAVTGTTKLAANFIPFASKRDVAAMLQLSVRTVDNYVAAGCPCIALSKRRLRFDLAEVRDWFKTQYGEQRRTRATGQQQHNGENSK